MTLGYGRMGAPQHECAARISIVAAQWLRQRATDWKVWTGLQVQIRASPSYLDKSNSQMRENVNDVTHSCQHGVDSQRNGSDALWNTVHEELRLFLAQIIVLPSIHYLF